MLQLKSICAPQKKKMNIILNMLIIFINNKHKDLKKDIKGYTFYLIIKK